jgi:hypothetical protein
MSSCRRFAIVWMNKFYADVPLTLISIVSLFFIPIINYCIEVILLEKAKSESERDPEREERAYR